MKTIMRMTGVAGVFAAVLYVYADTGSFSETLQPGAGSSVTLDAPSGVSTQTSFTVLSAAGSQALRAWTENQISDYGGNEDYGLRLNTATVTAEDVDGRTKITFAGGETYSRKFELYDGADLVINGGTFTNSLSFAAGPSDSNLKTAEQTVTVKGGATVQLLSRINNFPGNWGNLTRLNVENGTINFAHSGVAYPATAQFKIGSSAGSTGIVEVAAGSTIRTSAYAKFVYPAGTVQETEIAISSFGPRMVFGGMDSNASRAQHGVGILNLHGTAALGGGFRIGSPDSVINVYNGGKLLPNVNCTCEILSGTLNFYEGSDSDIRMLNIGAGGGGGGTGIINVYGGNLRVLGDPETYRGLTMPTANNAKSRAELNLLGGNFETRRLAPNYKSNATNNIAVGGKGWIRVVANGGSVSPFFSGTYPSNPDHDPHENKLFISGLDEAILGPKGLTVNVNGRYYSNGWISVNWPIGTTQDFTNMVDAVSGLETEGRLIITGSTAGEFYYNSLVSHHAVTELKGGTTFITNGADTASQKLIISGGCLALSNDYNNVTVKDLVFGGANGAGTIITDGTGALTATDTLTVESLNVVFSGAGGMDPETVYNVVRVAGDHAEELLPKVVGSLVMSGLPAGKAGTFTTAYADGYTTVKMQAVDPVAISQTWAGETASWNTASNWTPNETPGIFSDLLFPGSAAVKAIAVAQGGAAAGSLAFDSAAGYTISGEKLTLVGTNALAAKAVTVSSGKHVIENPFRSTGPISATVVSGAQMTFAGAAEISSIIKNGAGTFAVTNTGVANAGFTLNDGRLVIGPKTLGTTPLTLTACTNTTLEIVNNTGVEQEFPHTLNFNAAGNTQFVDLVIDGDITMPAFNKGNACWFKRGPGTLTLTNADKWMFSHSRSYQYGSVHHIDEDGRLQVAMKDGVLKHGNAEIIDGTVHIKGTGVSIGGGSSMCVAVGGHADQHSSTNAALILEKVLTAPTYFYVGVNNTTSEWGDVRRHVRVDLRDHTTLGIWQTPPVVAYGSFYPLGQNNAGGTDAAIDIEINYSGESKSGGNALALMMSRNQNSQSVITLTGGSQMFYKQLYGTGNATVNLRGASEIRCDEYYVNTHGNDSATELYFFKEGGHYMRDWSRITFNVSGRSTVRSKRIVLARADDAAVLKSWTAEPGVLTLNFDDGIWRFGEAADVEVTVACPMRKNVKINALAGGLEFQVPAGQTVVFNKDVNGAGGVKKTGAGRFEFGLGRVVGEFEISGDAITKATTNILEGAAGHTICCTGAVEVAEGTLAIREGAADPALAKVIVASGATLDLTGGTHTLAGVGGAGTVSNGTLADTAILLDPANPSAVPTFAATAALTGLTFVDLGYTEEHPVTEFPKDMLVARYEGAAPACTFKVKGTGLNRTWGTFTAQNGEIRVTVSYSGLMVIFR